MKEQKVVTIIKAKGQPDEVVVKRQGGSVELEPIPGAQSSYIKRNMPALSRKPKRLS